jgi:type IV pilus assembly protein PilN
MIQINLLPVRLKKQKEGARQIASIYLLTIVLAGAVMGYFWFYYDIQINARKNELSSLQKEVGKYAKFEVALQQIQNRKILVDRKRQVIKDLQNDRDAVVRMLALLSIQVPPEKMWFEKMTQTGPSVILDGVAQSNEAIVEFMRNLESSPYIEKGSINLVLSRQFAVKEMKLREFQLTYRFHPYSDVQKKLKM